MATRKRAGGTEVEVTTVKFSCEYMLTDFEGDLKKRDSVNVVEPLYAQYEEAYNGAERDPRGDVVSGPTSDFMHKMINLCTGVLPSEAKNLKLRDYFKLYREVYSFLLMEDTGSQEDEDETQDTESTETA